MIKWWVGIKKGHYCSKVLKITPSHTLIALFRPLWHTCTCKYGTGIFTFSIVLVRILCFAVNQRHPPPKMPIFHVSPQGECFPDLHARLCSFAWVFWTCPTLLLVWYLHSKQDDVFFYHECCNRYVLQEQYILYLLFCWWYYRHSSLLLIVRTHSIPKKTTSHGHIEF